MNISIPKPMKRLSGILKVLVKLELAEDAYVAENGLMGGMWYAYVRCRRYGLKQRKLHCICSPTKSEWWTT